MMEFHIFLNPDNPDEAEIIKLDMSNDHIKAMLLLGFNVYKYSIKYDMQVELSKKEADIRSDIAHEYESKLTQLIEENISLAKKLEDDIIKMEQSVANRYILDIDKRDLKIEHLTYLLSEAGSKQNNLEAKLEELYKEIYQESVQQLKETIKEKEMEITMMKHSNSVKGSIGESLLIDTLRQLYHNAVVEATGKVAHTCDVHMTLPTDEKYIFESKYKGNVDKKDILKFEADMRTLSGDGGGVSGGVFVSFVSKNIPGKGSLTIEILEDIKVPVLYVAYDNEQEFSLFFATHFMMFKSICEIYDMTKSDCTQNIDEMKVILEEINYFYNSILKNKKRLDDFKKSFTKYCTEIEDDNKDIIKRIETILKTNGISEKKMKQSFLCSKCNMVFTSKRALNKHTKEQHP